MPIINVFVHKGDQRASLRPLRQVILHVVRFVASHQDRSHRKPTLRVRGVRQELQGARRPQASHGVPQRRHHPLRALQSHIPLPVKLQKTHQEKAHEERRGRFLITFLFRRNYLPKLDHNY